MHPTPPQIGNGNRWQSLDVMRGVAVLLVLFRHLGLKAPTGRSTALYQFIYALQRGGWVGVDLFFVLSGFLVSGILYRQYQRDGHLSPIRFLIRRGFKIYPAFWVLIGVTMVWIWESAHRIPIKNALIELAFVQNYFSGLYAHTWSLAIEEHCYLGICVIFTILTSLMRGRDNPFGIIPLIVAVAVIGCLALRIQTIPPLTEKNFVLATGATHLRCDAFLIGSLIAYCYYFSSGRFLISCQRYQLLWLALGIACILPVFFLDIVTNRIVSTWLFTTNAIGGAFLLMGAVGSQGRPSPVAGMIGTIGEHSYSIYLWHVLVCSQWLPLVFIKYKIPMNIATWPAAFVIIGITTGIIASYLIERPALKLRDRWFPA